MMKKLNFLILAIAILFTSCNAGGQAAEEDISRDKMAEEIKALLASLMKQMDQPTIDTASAQTLTEKVETYVSSFPKDSLNPSFIYETAAVSRGIGDHQEAVKLWNEISTNYESYKRAPEALFFQAFTYDNDLQDTARARVLYESFLAKYPKHHIANDARMLLEAIKMGKSADQMIEEFKQKAMEEEGGGQ